MRNVAFRQDQLQKFNARQGQPPTRTRAEIRGNGYVDRRWTPSSNRDENHPAFSFPPGHSTTFAATSKSSGKKIKPNMEYQTKRIVVVFGDGSFSPSSPGKLPANFRLIRQKLKEKAKLLGCFPNDFEVEELCGKERMVVLDIGEFNTSVNWADPSLPLDDAGIKAKHVRGIYAVVTHPESKLLYCCFNSNLHNSGCYCIEP